MKLGPLTLTRTAQNAAPPKTGVTPQYGEIGAPGTQIFGGNLVQQDYNPDLMAPQCYDVYDKMRLSDGQVRAALAVIKLPILRAHWEVEAASDKAEDRMIAEFLESDLRAMTTSHIGFMREALLMLDYGSMPFEKVWYVGDDGLIHLRKMAPRQPRSITKWKLDDNGGFAGVQQQAIKASGFSLVDIPRDKMVVFVHEKEGSNMRGTSILRSAYKHWFYKDGHYRIDAIANERRGVGMDIGTIKPGATDKDTIKRTLESALMTFHAHEKNYFIEDEENYTMRVETGGASVGANAIMATIEHHDLRILRSVHAEFLNMGSGSTGSLAMHSDKTGFFMMALEATSDNLAETQTSHLIKPWVDYNWRVDEYPRMKYSRLDTRSPEIIADAVSKLGTGNFLTPSPATEAELRHLLDFPALEIDPPEVDDEPEDDENEAIAAIQQRQIARVREQIAAGKSPDEIRLQFKDELVAAIAGAA